MAWSGSRWTCGLTWRGCQLAQTPKSVGTWEVRFPCAPSVAFLVSEDLVILGVGFTHIQELWLHEDKPLFKQMWFALMSFQVYWKYQHCQEVLNSLYWRWLLIAKIENEPLKPDWLMLADIVLGRKVSPVYCIVSLCVLLCYCLLIWICK